MPKAKKVKARKKKILKEVDKGIINIHSSFNNTLINLTDLVGNTLAWASAGSLGFKGTKKSTPFAATQVAKEIIKKAQSLGISEVQIKIKGVGAGRDSAIRAFAGSDFTVSLIKDVTPMPHGGVRPKKVRKV